MPTKTTPISRLKLIAVVELLGFVTSLVVPITPSKTGREFHWPATWSAYFEDVLLSFFLVNIVFVVILASAWIYLKWSKRQDSAP